MGKINWTYLAIGALLGALAYWGYTEMNDKKEKEETSPLSQG
jgi:hypothetical protein